MITNCKSSNICKSEDDYFSEVPMNNFLIHQSSLTTSNKKSGIFPSQFIFMARCLDDIRFHEEYGIGTVDVKFPCQKFQSNTL